MTSVIINDILPRTQAIATAGQTVYSTDWTANFASDVVVYSRAINTAPNDSTQILNSSLYNVAFIGDQQIVQVTLVNASSLGDVVTITRMTPADRENLYTNTNFTPSMLNNDFGILTLVDQQAQLVNSQIAPRYNYSALITNLVDTILPILGANETWVKNPGDTAIIPYTLPASGIAPADSTYVLLMPDSTLPNSFSLSTLGAGLLVNDPGGTTLLVTTILGTTNQITVANGSGSGGDVGIAIATNPIMPGTAGMGIPSGTTGQRVIPGSNISLRYNTSIQSIEYYDGGWVQLSDNTQVQPGLINQLAYYAMSGDTISGLATVNDAVLTTSAGGAPTWINELTLALGGTNNSLTASAGGIVWSDASKLNILAGTSTAGLPLLSGNAATPTWGAFAISLGGALTTGGAVTFSGAHSFIGVLTGDTNVTFPTSGTLATTGGSVITINADSGSATPSAGTVTINGGSTGLTTLGSGSTISLTGTLGIGHGGTNVTSVTVSPTATAFAGWDVNKNFSANNFIAGYTTTATAASTTVLTVASTSSQFFTGSTTQTVTLPVTSTLVLGQTYYIVNNSSGVVTVQSSGGDTVVAMSSGTTLYVTCVLTSGTTAASWYADYAVNTPLTLPLALASGGTNAVLAASNGGIFYSTATAGAILAGTATANKILMSGATDAPTWSIPIYPNASATAGKVIISDGTNFISSTSIFPNTVGSAGKILRSDGTVNAYTTSTFADTYTASNLLYSNGANTVTGLATGNNGVLVTSAGGVPSISSTLPAALTIPQPGIVGVTDASNAAAGNTGQYIESVISSGSAISLTDMTFANVTSISLTAGDWDVWGMVAFTAGGSTIYSVLAASVSTTSATLGQATNILYVPAYASPIAAGNLPTGQIRVNVNTTTTAYLIGFAGFTVSTMKAYGFISARRVR